MKKILFITTSPNGENSFSNKLSNAILEKVTLTYPDSSVSKHNLAQEPLSHIDDTTLAAFFTPAEHRNETLNNAVKNSDKAINEIMQANIIIIGVPFYNFGIPSTLKAWVDHISRMGITFKYDENGMPRGLVENKKVYLAIASGGIYSEGPMKAYDFNDPYLRAILGFLGMTDVTTFRVEGTVIPGMSEMALSKGLATVNEFAF